MTGDIFSENLQKKVPMVEHESEAGDYTESDDEGEESYCRGVRIYFFVVESTCLQRCKMDDLGELGLRVNFPY